MQQRDIELLLRQQTEEDPNPPIPIFWEPTDQSGTAVMYLGHWNIVHIEDLRDRSVTYLDKTRCAKLYFDFDHFDEKWDKIIELCKDKSLQQIKELNFDGI